MENEASIIIINEEYDEEGKKYYSFTAHQGRMSWWRWGRYASEEEARKEANNIHR